MARIFNRGNILWIYYHHNNKAYRESLKLTDTKQNRRLAEELLLQKKLELRRSTHYRSTNNILLSDASNLFILDKKSETRHTNNYLVALKHFADFLQTDMPARSITEKHIKQFRNTLTNKSEHTVKNYLDHLKVFFKYLLKEGYIDKNPVTIKLTPFVKNINIYIDKDYRKLKLYLYIHNKEQYRFIHFLYLTGFRRSEALNIKWQDVDFRDKIIRLKNTKEHRIDIFPLYPELLQFLQQFKKKDGRIFNYSKDGLKFYQRALDRLNLPKYSLHDLRRKFGTRMAEKGLSPYELTKIMRHRSIKTSMKYYINIDIRDIGNKM